MSLGSHVATRQMAGPCLPVYRALIDHIVSDGAPPPDETLARLARTAPARVAMIRDALARQDWLTLDDDGALVSIYPFSLVPTGITVSIDGVDRYAVCAIDALGVAPMLRRAVLVSATCSWCEEPIVIGVNPEEIEGLTPPGAVVTARYALGPAVRSRCGVMRFACSEDHGRRWLDEHGMPDDVVLPVEEAFPLAREQFHRCYTHGRVAKPFERRSRPTTE